MRDAAANSSGVILCVSANRYRPLRESDRVETTPAYRNRSQVLAQRMFFCLSVLALSLPAVLFRSGWVLIIDARPAGRETQSQYRLNIIISTFEANDNDFTFNCFLNHLWTENFVRNIFHEVGLHFFTSLYYTN